MRLVLIRHGDAYAGLIGTIAGPIGCAGLTPLGKLQAEALRDRLATSGTLVADALLTSELPRAIQTAQIIAPALGFTIAEQDCDLCEVHTGEADNTHWADYPANYGVFDMMAEPDRPFAPEGDSWNSFHLRVNSAMERLAREHRDETVVAVCHAGVIMASIRTIFDMPHPGTGALMRPSNTGMTVWEHDETLDRWTLHTFNDAEHLHAVVAPPD
ncbi:MAG: histidine phosphatase family protein [Microthrixaceae bacterium]